MYWGDGLCAGEAAAHCSMIPNLTAVLGVWRRGAATRPLICVPGKLGIVAVFYQPADSSISHITIWQPDRSGIYYEQSENNQQ